MKQKIIIFFLVVSLIGNYYAFSNIIRYKKIIEYHKSEQLYSQIYISTVLLKNISDGLTMPYINASQLKSNCGLLMSFNYVHVSFSDYTEIADRLFKFITKIETKETTINSANKVGQYLHDKSQILLQDLTVPRNRPRTNYEDIEAVYKDILSTLKEYTD